MTIEKFLEQAAQAPIALADLTKMATDRAAFGDDVIAGLKSQCELRSAAADKVLTDAKEAGRGDLLASEARDFDRNVRERDSILGLIRQCEQRTGDAYRVPASQTAATETRDTDVSPVLTRTDSLREWTEKRGGYTYQGERGATSMRFGRMIRALALGDRRGLTALEQRALSEGTDSAGGYTVPDILSASFIDRTRNAMIVQQAGAQLVPMTSDTLSIARVAQPTSVSPDIATAAWRLENADIEESDIELERVQFTARSLAVLLKLSVELGDDSVNIDQIIEAELSRQLALELDRVALLGSGTAPEPRGIVNMVGVPTTALNATPDDYDFIIDAIGRCWANNITPNARVYNSSLATSIAKFKSSADSQPLRVPEAVAAVPAFRTNQIGNAGTSPDETKMIVGDFTQLLIGLRQGFRLEISRVSGDAFSKLQIHVRAHLRADVQAARVTAFDVTTDIGF